MRFAAGVATAASRSQAAAKSRRHVARPAADRGAPAESRTSLAWVELFRQPLLLLRRDAAVHHANAAGRTLLAQGCRLRELGDGVAAILPNETVSLRAMVAAAADGGAGALLLTAAEDSMPLPLLLLPGMAQMAILVASAPPDREQSGDLARLRAIYGLTNAEARIAFAAAQGASLREVATALGISDGTARTHLKRVFCKTATSRKAELVALLLRGPLALR